MVSLFEQFFQDWRAEKHGSEGERAELRRKTELLQKRELSAQQNMNMSTHACTAALEASRTSRTSRIIMRKSTMVTFTSGDRHRFEPPRTQTAFIDLTNLFAKKLLQPTWLENYKALGFQTNSSRMGKLFPFCCFYPEYPVVPGCRWGIKKGAHLRTRAVLKWASTPKRKVSHTLQPPNPPKKE